MNYSKQNFSTGNVLTATQLNNMDDALIDVRSRATALEEDVSDIQTDVSGLDDALSAAETSLGNAIDTLRAEVRTDATTSAGGRMSASDKAKLDSITSGANAYTLPVADASTLGGVKVGNGLSIASGVLSADYTSAATSSAMGLMSAQDKQTLTAIASGYMRTTRYSLTLPANGWELDSTAGWHQQTLSLPSGLVYADLASAVADIDLSGATTATAGKDLEANWALISRMYVDANGVHAIAYEDAPEVALTFILAATGVVS